MTTTTIEMYGDVAPVGVLSGSALGGAVLRTPDASVLPVWRARVTDGGSAPITVFTTIKHNSTRVSVPGCRGTT